MNEHFSLVIPSAFITVVTIVGFFTPHSTTGENTEKVSLGVTALLSMAIIMMMVSDEVPATSEVIPLIGKYYIGLIFLIFMAAFTTTLTLSYQMRGNSGQEVDPRVRDFFFYQIAANPCISWAFSFQLPKKLLRSDHRKQSFFFINGNHANGYAKGELRPITPPAHIVKMEEITGGGSIKSFVMSSDSATTTNQLTSSLLKIKLVLDDMKASIQAERELKRIKFEWQQVTRLIDRCIMFGYILITIVFALVMLASREPPIVLSDVIMDSVKST
ncbi:unnamed protein product [Caenorhabditis sp. 36 PRJEB53466]|nr:unnamed protein product [Caenorhabditis sp. 36 PRJEB53466]